MELIYVTNARLPTEKAHGLATVKLAAAFAAAGATVTIVCPRRRNAIRENIYAYYDVPRNFSVRYLPTLDLFGLGLGDRPAFLLQLLTFSLASALRLAAARLTGRLGKVTVFSHDLLPLWLTSFIAPDIIYDVHDFPAASPFSRRVLARARVIAVQTRWKVDALARAFGVPAGKIVAWPNGTDVERFALGVSSAEARSRLGLERDQKIALYAGSLQRWKGVSTLIEAAELLPADVSAYIVGGAAGETAALKTKNEKLIAGRRLILTGQRPWSEMPLWLAAADVLVLPNTGREEISRYWTSPMKLFEYMAAGRPIVASDIPSIREVIDDSMAFFATPDDPRSLVEAICKILADPTAAAHRAARAAEEVRRYTWQARAENILAAIDKRGV